MPPALLTAIAVLLEGVSRKDLARRADKLSAAYRQGGTSAIVADEGDALAYLVTRMPATYAAVRAVLARVMEVLPEFTPASFLDVGAGPGTAAWAVRDTWPALGAVLIEPNVIFRRLAARLMPDAEIVSGDLGTNMPPAGLVMASYVLAELPEAEAARIALKLWTAAEQMLMLIEPGTPQGFARIRAARAALIAAGGHVVAPCTHGKDCPLKGEDWCHFSERLARSRDHKIAKGADAPFEDERYSYVAVSRAQVDHARRARIIKPVLDAKPGLTLPLCDAAGARNAVVARRDKSAFRTARRKGWGDLF
ncbi:MAG TPA: small ribosomal subunit Rsm22 family protein [Rhizomicrobium sp.]